MSRSATAMLSALGVGAASELTAAPARALPVRGELAELLPWGGLRRGSTVSVRESTSLLFTLVAAATAEGCWAAVVGLPGCGVLAAAELGVAVHRLALVPRPGRDRSEVEKTVAALLDGFDLVSVAISVPDATARKLSARARHRKAVLLPFATPWPGADVELSATPDPWRGLSQGHGVLTSRTATVRTTGRGAAAKPRQTRLLLSAPTSSAPVGSTAPSSVLAASSPADSASPGFGPVNSGTPSSSMSGSGTPCLDTPGFRAPGSIAPGSGVTDPGAAGGATTRPRLALTPTHRPAFSSALAAAATSPDPLPSVLALSAA